MMGHPVLWRLELCARVRQMISRFYCQKWFKEMCSLIMISVPNDRSISFLKVILNGPRRKIFFKPIFNCIPWLIGLKCEYFSSNPKAEPYCLQMFTFAQIRRRGPRGPPQVRSASFYMIFLMPRQPLFCAFYFRNQCSLRLGAHPYKFLNIRKV